MVPGYGPEYIFDLGGLSPMPFGPLGLIKSLVITIDFRGERWRRFFKIINFWYCNCSWLELRCESSWNFLPIYLWTHAFRICLKMPELDFCKDALPRFKPIPAVPMPFAWFLITEPAATNVSSESCLLLSWVPILIVWNSIIRWTS